MAVFADLIRWKIEVSILALTGLVAATLMAGTTNTSSLLYGSVCARKRRQDQYFSPERVQLLLFTAGAGLHYLTLVLNIPYPGTFPDIPRTWPRLSDGSNAISLDGKGYARWLAM
jgi:hypothetical protein